MSQSLDIAAFLALSQEHPIIDVRTPAEFDQGHIPGAHNVPLFTNEERAEVGTLYKQVGREEAMLTGLEAVGPKMRHLVEQTKQIAPQQTVLLHCWRGGMRSSSVAWLLELFGFQTYTLQQGYKAFRRYVLASFIEMRQVIILGGYTGSAKTETLHALRRQGAQAIDLEALAHHKGSAFGQLGETPQPSQQQFENELAMQWRQLDPTQPVWLEDESRHVGRRTIPNSLWNQMRAATVVFLDLPRPARVQHLVAGYGQFDPEALAGAIQRLRKRLGDLNTRLALDALSDGDLAVCADILLREYYDRAYRQGLQKRAEDTVFHLPCSSINPEDNAATILALTMQHLNGENNAAS